MYKKLHTASYDKGNTNVWQVTSALGFCRGLLDGKCFCEKDKLPPFDFTFAGEMKNGLLYLLVFATFLPTVSQWGVVAYYHANRDYIARVLCENRDKPDLHCDGQCYLAKQLKARQDRQDKETTDRVQNSPVLQLFCQANIPFQFSSVWAVLLSIGLPVYCLPSYIAPLTGLFHPPRF